MFPTTVPWMMISPISISASTMAPSPMTSVSSENTSPLNRPSMRTVPSKVSLPSNCAPRPRSVVISLNGACLAATIRWPHYYSRRLLDLADARGDVEEDERQRLLLRRQRRGRAALGERLRCARGRHRARRDVHVGEHHLAAALVGRQVVR